MGMGGKQPPYICFENNGGLGTIGKISIVMNNDKVQWKECLLSKTIGIRTMLCIAMGNNGY
jgi:hypothetical protein